MPHRDSSRELVDRVAGSAFHKSNRLREMFVFLCQRTLSDPAAPIREQDIGVEVFGRALDYDTNLDNLVRVQASQLRKKLQQYFEGDGRAEPVIIDIPKGGYTPVFRPRVVELPRLASPEAPARRFGWYHHSLLVALLAGAVIASAAWLLVLGGRLSPSSPRPTVDRLWRQMFGNGRPICIVLSDANLTVFEDMIHRGLDVREYRNKTFLTLADQLLASPEQRALARGLMTRSFTHVSDAHVAGALEELGAAHQIPTQMVFARDFGQGYVDSHNVILLGSRRANPWVQLFEERLNFRSGMQEAPLIAYFQNQSPLPGESATYPLEWGRRGYCRVAFLPCPNGTGNALLISGTEMASSEAGGQFIASEHWVQALRSRFGLGGRAPLPYFEVLLKVDFLLSNTTALKFEIVAHRVIRF